MCTPLSLSGTVPGRYGNDDQYLSTVIRYDLEFLDLCPCMVDVEIIDAKNGQVPHHTLLYARYDSS